MGERIQTGVCPALRQAVGPNGTVPYLPATLAVMRHSGDQIRLAVLLGGTLKRHARFGWGFSSQGAQRRHEAPEAIDDPSRLGMHGPWISAHIPKLIYDNISGEAAAPDQPLHRK